MTVKYTDKQLKIIKGLVEYSESFAQVVLETIKTAGLDKVEGCEMAITINPKSQFVTRYVRFGADTSADSGMICMTKGTEDKEYVPTGNNTPEYVCLLASDEIKARMQKILSGMETPPDSVWLRSDYDPDSVDSGVSVNG